MDAPAMGSPLWASLTVPDTPPNVSGRATFRVTSTATCSERGAFVTSTSWAWYSPGESVGLPSATLMTWLPPTATSPVAGSGVSQSTR